MYTIKTLNNISQTGLKELEVDGFTIDNEAASPDGIVCRSADLKSDPIPDGVKAIARAGAGVNNIPVEQCSERGIVVFNTPGANANGVKELVIAGMLLSGRRITEGVAWAREAAKKGDGDVSELVEKEKKRFAGPEIAGKTLGVVGLGAIGVLVANAAAELGMTVVGFDPYISVTAAWGLRRDIERSTSMDDLLARADYLTVHAPLTDKTRGMIGAEQLSKIKRGARIMNMARGPLVDDEAVLKALDEGRISHYVTDFPNSKLVANEKVIPIPHLGASTPESEDNCAVMAAREIREFLATGNITNSVNFPDCVMPISDEFRIVIANRNIPNMVGQITHVLADEDANISDMLNRHRDGVAYNIIDLEQKISEESIKRLSEIEGVITVRSIGKTSEG